MTELEHPDLPSEIEDVETAERLAANLERVAAFGEALAKKRDEAIAWRKKTGIEEDWKEEEDAYQGVDAANQGSHTYKPQSTNGSFVHSTKSSPTQSTVFLNITRPYVESAAARVADMLMPNDDFPFAYRPTPIANGKMDPVAGAVKEQIDQLRAKYIEQAEGAQKQVQDWMVECCWHAEVRKVIAEMARLGTGIMKGPFPVERKARRAQIGDGGSVMMVIENKVAPAVKAVSVWNFYPAPGCGENFREGGYCWEKDTINARQLRDLRDLGDEYGYLPEQIDKVLKEGPQKKHVEEGRLRDADDKVSYEIWYGHVLSDREDLVAAGLDDSDLGDLDVAIPAEVVLVNDTVIKAALNPMQSGDFPYDMVPWSRRDGLPWGSGVARHINAPQRMVNAAARHLSDNSGQSAGPQFVIDTDVIEPADGTSDYTITPRKAWRKKAGYSNIRTEDAFKIITTPNMQEQLMPIIQFGLKMAEDVTNLPMLMQGQQGAAPDTVGGMTILNNNATVVLRSVIRNIDDNLIETQATRFYEWLMIHGKDESIKGDYQIDAIGSTSMIERDLANVGLKDLASMSLNPAFGYDPELIGEELAKVHRIDPKRIMLSDEKKEALKQQPPPEAPQVTVAKIRSQTDLAKAEMDTDRDTAFVQAQNERTQIDAQARERELQTKYQLALLDYANKRQITLDKAKAELTKVSMQLTVQKQLNGSNAAQPAVEPRGRAPEGQAFQK